MKIAIAAAFAALTITSGAALAQGLQPSGTRAGGPGQMGASGEIMPEQRSYLRSYVMRQPGAAVTMDQQVVPGYVLPGAIELQPFAEDVYGTVPSARGYRYVRTGRGVVLVDPATRRVVEVID